MCVTGDCNCAGQCSGVFLSKPRLVAHFEGGRVFWLHFAPIVDAGGGDIGMAEPLLDLRDVGVVVQRIRRGCGSASMGADLEAKGQGQRRRKACGTPPKMNSKRAGC